MSRISILKNMFRRNLPGFTLIEMSFVLIIAGLIMGLSLPLFTTMLQQQKQRQTQDHQEQILYALAAFLNQHGYLPTPADLASTAPEHGTATAGTCAAGHCQGIIPYRTLGLMENLAKDGYHRWMTYVTSKQLTATTRVQDTGAAFHEINSAPNTQSFCEVVPGPSSLQLLDVQNQSMLRAPANVQANSRVKDLWAVILISQEPQGSDDGVPLNNGPIFTIQNGTRVKAVTRNNILAIYARNPCQPPPSGEQPKLPEVEAQTQQTLPYELESKEGVDAWMSPLPKQPESIPDDQR